MERIFEFIALPLLLLICWSSRTIQPNHNNNNKLKHEKEPTVTRKRKMFGRIIYIWKMHILKSEIQRCVKIVFV